MAKPRAMGGSRGASGSGQELNPVGRVAYENVDKEGNAECCHHFASLHIIRYELTLLVKSSQTRFRIPFIIHKEPPQTF